MSSMAPTGRPDGGGRSLARPGEAVQSDIFRQGVTLQRPGVRAPTQYARHFSIMEVLAGFV
jgi:hypothetical protein